MDLEGWDCLYGKIDRHFITPKRRLISSPFMVVIVCGLNVKDEAARQRKQRRTEKEVGGCGEGGRKDSNSEGQKGQEKK